MTTLHAEALTQRLPMTPRGLRRAQRLPAADTVPAGPCLVPADGGEDLIVLDIDEGLTTIGRSFRADLELEDRSVSRRHALLERSGDDVWILDDHSVNGVLVNGRRTLRARLEHDDLIQLGRVALRYAAPRGPSASG